MNSNEKPDGSQIWELLFGIGACLLFITVMASLTLSAIWLVVYVVTSAIRFAWGA